MRSLFLIFFSVLCVFTLTAQDLAVIIKEADHLEEVPNEKAAFSKFKEALKIQPVNQYALNKCSELCSRLGKRQRDEKTMEEYYTAAKLYAGTALKVNPLNSESHCVMAIALGRSTLNKSGKEKIAAAKQIKQHVDAAIKNDPKNFKAWHVLGRWHYEISLLNAFERTAVKLFFGGFPPASLPQSILAFEKSQSLTGGFILNYFEMAKAYKKNDQRDKAIATLSKMLSIPNKTEDDPFIKEEGRELLREWK